MRCTAGPRTIIDVAGRYSYVERLELVDRAICDRMVSRPNLYRRASELIVRTSMSQRSSTASALACISASSGSMGGAAWAPDETPLEVPDQSAAVPSPRPLARAGAASGARSRICV